ncbi:MAG: bifunctional ADP-heptose synthase [Nanoarchaeota archaeon]|nr:bifunctional ADP-heptose synthase [Nanoarchaeota archaeon]
MENTDFNKLIEIINRFGNKKVAVLGDIILDHYIYGSPRGNPEADALCLTIDKDQEDFRLGGAANQARNIKSLGGEIYLYGLIGEDESGETIKRLCREAEIILISAKSGETIKKTRVMGKRFNHPLMRLDYGEQDLTPISQKDESFLYETFISKGNYDGILIPDYNKRVLRAALPQKVISWANQRGIFTLVDPKSKNASEANKFHGATLVKPNLDEAKLIMGESEMDKETLVQALKKKMGSKYAAITCGKEGIITYDGGYHNLLTSAREVVDVSGAGDTTAAALLLSLISGANIVEAATIANYAAGIAVEKAGTAAVTREELIKRITQERDGR